LLAAHEFFRGVVQTNHRRDPVLAGDDRAVIQFRVSGREAGDYHIHIERGRCRSFAGEEWRPGGSR